MGTQAQFFGGASRITISADTKLTRHAGTGSKWCWQVTASAGSLAVQLPDARTIDSTGYPVIQIVNEGANAFAVEDADGTELVASGSNPQNTVLTFALFDRSTAAGDWENGSWVQGAAAGPGATIKPWTLGGTGTALSDKAWEYDFVAQTWAQAVATAANTHDGSAGFAVNGEGYVVGAAGALDHFDPSTWTGSLTDRDIGSADAHGISHETDDKGYVFGATIIFPDAKSVDEYDVSADTWTAMSDLSAGLLKASGATGPSNKLYTHGGTTDTTNAITSTSSYDITGDSHTASLTSSLVARMQYMAADDGDLNLWAYAGFSTKTGPRLEDVEKYDTVADSWSTKNDSPQGANQGGGATRISLNGFIYTVGGETLAGNSDAVYAHTPGNDTYVAETDHAASGSARGLSQGGVMSLDV